MNETGEVKPKVFGSILKQRPIKPEPVECGGDDSTSQPRSVVKTEKSKSKKKKADKWERLGRIKPDPSQRDYERLLAAAATKGVVQLFNAIKEHQNSVSTEVSKAKTVRKTEKVLKNLKKDRFFDHISSKSSGSSTKRTTTKALKKEADDKQTSSKEKDGVKWDVLKDDFLSTSKNWDRDNDDNEEDITDLTET